MAKACCRPNGGTEPGQQNRKKKHPRDGQGGEGPKKRQSRLFAMVGNPNVGKTTLINAVSGAMLRIGNWPGTTVERMEINFTYHCDPKDIIDKNSRESDGLVVNSGADGSAAHLNSGDQGLENVHSEGGDPSPAEKTESDKNDGLDIDIHLVDLPGAYWLTASDAEERVTRNELLTHVPDAVVNVLDAGNLERNLAMTLELIELGLPVVIALNLMDEAEDKGVRLNVEALSKALDIPVVPTVAVKEEGVAELMRHAILARHSSLQIKYSEEIEKAIADLSSYLDGLPSARWLSAAALVGDELKGLNDEIVASAEAESVESERPHQKLELPSDFRKKAEYYRRKFAESGIDCFLEVAEARYALARKVAEASQNAPAGVHKLTQAVDKIILHPLWGIPIFLVCMLILFRCTFVFSDPWVDWMDVIKGVFMGWTASIDMPDMLRSFVMNGILEGVGTVVAFTPVLFVLYAGLSFLEASGFLARSAFLIDRVMKAMHLPGKAFIPILVGLGCNVPGIAATRTLGSFNERLRVSMAVPFAPCSARMAVFAFFAALFFPRHPAYTLFFIYGISLVVGLFTIMLMGRVLHSDETDSVMELPSYRLPTFKIIWKQAVARTVSFLESAGSAIFIAVLCVWVINSFPLGDVNNSYYARLSHWFVGFTQTFGITDWHLAGALIPGFVAKEVVVGSLAVSYFGSGGGVEAITLGTGLEQIFVGFFEAIWGTIKAFIQLFGMAGFFEAQEAPSNLGAVLLAAASPRAILAYMVYVLLYMPCVGTISALKIEFGWKWTFISIAYSLLVAWILAVIVYYLPLGNWLA